MTKTTYWYVVYNVESEGVMSIGCSSLEMESAFFPVGEVTNMVQARTQELEGCANAQVIVLSWTKLTKAQYKEWESC